MSLEVEACWPCVVDLHEECLDLTPVDEVDDRFHCCCYLKPKTSDEAQWAREVGRPVSAPGDVSDVLSTGRKRAAMLYPINEGMLCEWAGLRNAGGGVRPIIGCRGNTITATKGGANGHLQGDVHHGPDKNTLANQPGNAHRICVFCHHRWHAENDPFYGKRPKKEDGKVDGEQPFLPTGEWVSHDADTLATDEELDASEAYWKTSKDARMSEPLDSID